MCQLLFYRLAKSFDTGSQSGNVTQLGWTVSWLGVLATDHHHCLLSCLYSIRWCEGSLAKIGMWSWEKVEKVGLVDHHCVKKFTGLWGPLFEPRWLTNLALFSFDIILVWMSSIGATAPCYGFERHLLLRDAGKFQKNGTLLLGSCSCLPPRAPCYSEFLLLPVWRPSSQNIFAAIMRVTKSIIFTL